MNPANESTMKIICIGRNYRAHARELNNPVPDVPLFFMKPETSLLRDNQPFRFPEFSEEVHHEVEVVVKIDRPGRRITREDAPGHYRQLGLGIDFTARDLQKRCKEKGWPWEIAKSFDGAAPLGRFLSMTALANPAAIGFRLLRNGKAVQEGNTSDMLFSIDRIIAHVSRYVTLEAGDLIYTGTPEGVGPVAIGDRLVGEMEGEVMFDFRVE